MGDINQTPESVPEASLSYEYPVLDVMGSPRMWVDNQGNVLSRSFAGPYGEDLGFYHDQPFTKLGFASLQDEHQDAGVFYTPNRYLGTAARFLSTDPSGTFNVHDPRTFNQYAYVVQDPLLTTDAAGLGEPQLMHELAREQEAVVHGTMTRKQYDTIQEARAAGVAVGIAVLLAAEAPQSIPDLVKAAYDIVKQNYGEAAKDVLRAALKVEKAAGNAGDLRNTWGAPDTLEEHFKKHGAQFGAESPGEYAHKATDLLQRASQEHLPTKVDKYGTIRIWDPKTNAFGSYNPNGTTRTLFKPRNGLAYWAKQLGVEPW